MSSEKSLLRSSTNYLLDRDFLRRMDEYYQRKVYAKIISLDMDENPIAEITGNVQQGSINVNGASAVRRTCNLTLVTGSIAINELDWTLKTKIKVLIGLKNFIDPEKYDDIIWFKQGTYVLTSFSSQYNLQGYTITLQAKDKMCLLNGEVGGNVTFTHDFGTIDIKHEGYVENKSLLIYDIIREAIHVYAHEPYENIIINDLDSAAVELLAYRGKESRAYIYIQTDTKAKQICFSKYSNLGDIFEQQGVQDGSIIAVGEHEYYIVKSCGYGDTIGYRIADLTYVGDLIVPIGGALTTMLDKIIKMLGEFEYFYDVDGRFIFQRQKIYHNIAWSNNVKTGDETYQQSLAYASSSVYEFKNNVLIESFANKPVLNNIKNDFAVWGEWQGTSQTIPILLRYAIDSKPLFYRALRDGLKDENRLFIVKERGGKYDWRELIYQMALDDAFLRGKVEDVRQANLIDAKAAALDSLNVMQEEGRISPQDLIDLENNYLYAWDSGYGIYYADMLDCWRNIYDPDSPDWSNNDGWNPVYIKAEADNSIIFNEPQILPFWIDFADINSELGEYSIQAIGRRPKVVNDTAVKAIFFRDTPEVLFVDSEDEEYESGDISYTRFNLPSYYTNYFAMSSQGKSAKEVLDNLLYQHTYYQEQITLNTIPIYYLEPNTRISVQDTVSGIDGDYIIKSFNISLAHDGMMSITATRAAERII